MPLPRLRRGGQVGVAIPAIWIRLAKTTDWDWERVRPARGVGRLAQHILARQVRRETPRTATGTVALPAKKMF